MLLFIASITITDGGEVVVHLPEVTADVDVHKYIYIYKCMSHSFLKPISIFYKTNDCSLL